MRRPRVILGMSGGADSSAAAVLLKAQGYDVTGVTLRTWPDEAGADRRWQERACCKVGVARFVAQKLGFPHYVVNVEEAFRRLVVSDFVEGYEAGETPNPCVRCNERVKFGLLFEIAQRLGGDRLATGHYARLDRPAGGPDVILRGRDSDKDQSYFLYRLRPDILSRLIFPLGDRTKSEVWPLIEELGLPVEEMKESQEICFVTSGDYREFLNTEAPEAARAGEFVSVGGAVLGTHRGVTHYTVGQRRGLGISSSSRLYVVGIEAAQNKVVLGEACDLLRSEVVASDLNLFFPYPAGPLSVLATPRYRARPVPATLYPQADGTLRVRFGSPQRSLTPGQSLVFYFGDTLSGGGLIRSIGD